MTTILKNLYCHFTTLAADEATAERNEAPRLLRVSERLEDPPDQPLAISFFF